ncbi:MAG: hypothetical protein IVW54_21555 [Candidatus Binataceae bacterium]|nr:hypothetical protein [Candidatus Binataceae bacterium]
MNSNSKLIRKNPSRLVGRSERVGKRREPISSVETVILKIAKVRYLAFRERFGRDPFPDEPLFFDPSFDEPTAPPSDEMRDQLLAAASATRSDCVPLLRFFGLQ